MYFKGDFQISYLLAIVSLALFCLCYCSPISYKEDTTTPRKYNDQFKIKKEYKTISNNHTSNFRIHPFRSDFMNGAQHNKEGAELPRSMYKSKSVSPGETILKQSDDDDDDDDDGGEYEGLDYNNGDADKKKQHVKQDSVPMMIIRELDMVAVEIPLREQKEQSEWSEWSQCNKPCGDGLQSRWRLKSGVQEREQQVRPCHTADCSSNDFHCRTRIAS